MRIFLFKKTKKNFSKKTIYVHLKKRIENEKKEKETVFRRKISCWKGKLIIVLLHGSALNPT